MQSRPVEQMHAILQDEQRALLSGDLAALEKIAQRKDRAATRLARARPNVAELDSLRGLTARNATLLDTVRDAIASVRALANDVPTPPETLAYSADGTRQSLQNRAGRLAQKA